MRYLIILFFFPFHSFADINLSLQNELLEMKHRDQNTRKEMNKFKIENITKEFVEKQKKSDEINTNALKSMIKKHSWLTKDLVGVEGMGAAFLVIQHSRDIVFKEQMLPLLKKSYLNNDGINGQDVALLTDRILIAQGKKQKYGTQADLVDSKIVLSPIEDEMNVDKRRKEMKMPPLEYYLKVLEEAYGIKDHPEINLN